ncbi:methyltransferase domain-containing protein [Candidatus Pelagibacter sp.]|nr:methyltransferase domain-containing protein [Candidatus Pelagibacter sp.]
MKKTFLNLGYQPLANDFKKNKTKIFYKLKILFDTKTKLVSINKKFDKKVMFNKTYPYRSSQSLTIKKHFKLFSNKLRKIKNFQNILEIGSNDGAFAINFKKQNIVCVEPCLDVGNELKKKNFNVYTEYFDNKLSTKLKNKYKKFDLIFSANTITHINNLKQVLKNIQNILSDDGVFVLEEPSFLECFKKNSFDQFYNEHVYVLSAISLTNILKNLNLKIFKIDNTKVHGGSLRYFIIKKKNKNFKIEKNYRNQILNEKKYGLDKFSSHIKFKNNSIKIKKKLQEIFKSLKENNCKIIGYGASAKAVTILNYCNLKEEYIDYFLDTTKNKVGKFLPGTKIKVKKYKPELINKNYYYFLGAWNFKDEILIKEKNFLKKGGKFISHLPIPHIFSSKNLKM